jgi:hypothetical protein
MRVITEWKVGGMYLDCSGDEHVRYECISVLSLTGQPVFIRKRYWKETGELWHEGVVTRTPSGRVRDEDNSTGDIVKEYVPA